jgi:ornithine cyclodeaminase/alanine dehydrogenase-like protein (mu-crystallin family)
MRWSRSPNAGLACITMAKTACAEGKFMPNPIRLLILGTGGMANTHAEAFAAMPDVSLVAGVDTRPEPLAAFCDRHAIANRFASLDAALPGANSTRSRT